MNTTSLQATETSVSNNRHLLPEEYFELKSRIHDCLLDLVDLSILDRVEPEILKPELRSIVNKILQEEKQSLSVNEILYVI